MPFGGWFDKYYAEIYVPAIEEAGFEAKRADDIYRPGNIVNDIWNYTKDASVVLADLTDKNPNVFYELGLAHAITKPAVLITASMNDIPFDLRSLRVIVFDKNSPNWGDILKNKIGKALSETIKSPEDAIPPTFLDVNNTKRLKVGEEEKELLLIRKELDSLKREVRSGQTSIDIPKVKINSGEAVSVIQSYLKQGLNESKIINLLKPEGHSENWIKEVIKIVNKNSS